MTRAGTQWDVAVVGAGPAGATAAWAAATAGARVVLLERSTLPRYKTCGGGITGTSLRSLPAGLQLPARDTIREAVFAHDGHRERARSFQEPLLRMVFRDELDAALVAAAQEAGVELRQRTLVRGVEETAAGPVLRTDGGDVLARAVVGADGSASRIGQHVGVVCDQVDLGLEVEVEAGARAEEWAGRVHLDWGPVPGSYGWVFPKGDTLTVGVIAARGRPAETRDYLTAYLRRLGLAAAPVTRDSGHLTRCRAPGSPLRRGSVLVAGDAAGLLEPWTREGISFALRSGRLAGEAAARLAAGEPGPAYEGLVEAELGAEMAAGRRCLRLFERRPGLVHAAISRTGRGAAAFARISRGETTLARALGHRGVAPAVGLLAR
ncbi:geranylgeranyl reductase family protein [Motilibacter aurantiacus]|uniref:geranylgeranyl reductase family protein n=1 Tax=Motilibacter aurantiacus TaxID=2714955 RepID=UPI00140CC3EA|nr:geranylgeranyl reductase family protein [Motilibacter aurantiacus]NHC46471.1 geranylgeranyl reductase family protein [Motilibacter aurantiacus]